MPPQNGGFFVSFENNPKSIAKYFTKYNSMLVYKCKVNETKEVFKMLKVNYSKLFKDAHKEAKEIIREVGDYMVAFKIALTDQWQAVKTTKLNDKQIAALENDGWARWTKGNFDRLYFNAHKNGVLGLDYYKSGKISYSAWGGEEISHGEAYRIQGMKCYIDIDNAKVVVKFWGSNDDEAEMLQTVAQKSLDKVIA